MSVQLDIFKSKDVEVKKPEPTTTVRLGSREARIPLRKQRREALTKLKAILTELEGQDIHIGSYDAGGRHYWLDKLKLPRLKVEGLYSVGKNDEYLPSVIILWGSRGASVRIFTEYLVAVRVQEYFGYWLYLLDFRNGFWESRIDSYREHYTCLHIVKFKD